jgi:hypothetical protein
MKTDEIFPNLSIKFFSHRLTLIMASTGMMDTPLLSENELFFPTLRTLSCQCALSICNARSLATMRQRADA